MHIAGMSAVAAMDLAGLEQQAAVVERAQVRPSLFEEATEIVRQLTRLAKHNWDVVDEVHRDIFRHLARELCSDPKASWFERQRAKLEVLRMFSQQGFAGTMKQMADYENARREYVSVVLGADERANELLQQKIDNAVSSALDPSSRAVVLTSREQLDEWFKRLPS